MPTQKLYSEFAKPASRVVGTSGSADARFDVLTPSATALPSRMKGSDGKIGLNTKSTRPLITSANASGPPLNGTCTPSNPALRRKRSALRWVAEPLPGCIVEAARLGARGGHKRLRRSDVRRRRDHEHVRQI